MFHYVMREEKMWLTIGLVATDRRATRCDLNTILVSEINDAIR